ncbi:MAG: DNA-directed RNA polymerase subunit omega [Cyanobacteria bacterium REEB65]|nr:DNA-directed RNA polymerase subunit omega [Cyanobacteria bacterium REEB65]
METHELTLTADHSELLVRYPNRYELVLKVARRAKQLKDEMARMPGNETMKPIPMAITELLVHPDEAQ